MNGRVPESRIQTLERLLALRAPRSRSRGRILLDSLFPAALIAIGAYQFFTAEYPGQRWFMLAVVFIMAALLLGNTGEAVYAGAFGARFRRQGRVLRVAGYLLLMPAYAFVFAALGFAVADVPGAIVGGVAGVISAPLYALFRLRRANRS